MHTWTVCMRDRPCHRIDARFPCTCARVVFSVYVMDIMQKHTIVIQAHVTYNDGLDRAYTALKLHVWRWHLLWFLALLAQPLNERNIVGMSQVACGTAMQHPQDRMQIGRWLGYTGRGHQLTSMNRQQGAGDCCR